MICQQHLPFITDRVIALTLSENKEVSEQFSRFCSYIQSFSQLIQLQSLTFYNVRSCETMLEIIQKCHDLCNFTHLKFHLDYTIYDQATLQLIIDNIWDLPKLTHCDLSIHSLGSSNRFCTPTKISTSLEYISVCQYVFTWHQLNQLFRQTPRLKHLAICIDSYAEVNHFIPHYLPTLIALNIDISSRVNNLLLISFFQNTPNLRHLNISLRKDLIDGQQWEQIIHNYLPKLKILRLQMQNEYCDDDILHDRIKISELLNSFRSPFWIDEHQWFIRCLRRYRAIYLHTFSSGFKYYNSELPDYSMSTSSHDDRKKFYDNLIDSYDQRFFTQSIPPDIDLSNIQYLRIKLPIDNQFWFIVPSLKRLDSLSILNYRNEFQSELQAILDQATQLRCLHIHQDISLPLQTSLFTCSNASIRRFLVKKCGYYFSKDECRQLICSPLGTQCDVLSVMVYERQNVIYLIEILLNLRVLNIECKDDKYSTGTNDKLANWLRNHLSSTCSIVRNSIHAPNSIRICL
jgi:hypothetical protein